MMVNNAGDVFKLCISTKRKHDDTASGKISWCQTGLEIHRENDFHSLHCVYRDRLLTFSHTLYWKNIWEPRGDRVIMESALYRTVFNNGVAVYRYILLLRVNTQFHKNLICFSVNVRQLQQFFV